MNFSAWTGNGCGMVVEFARWQHPAMGRGARFAVYQARVTACCCRSCRQAWRRRMQTRVRSAIPLRKRWRRNCNRWSTILRRSDFRRPCERRPTSTSFSMSLWRASTNNGLSPASSSVCRQSLPEPPSKPPRYSRHAAAIVCRQHLEKINRWRRV